IALLPVRMTRRLERLTRSAIFLTALAPLAAGAQTATSPKLDESLRQALEAGCTTSKAVIVTTKPGFREAVRSDLAARGATIYGEYPALEAISARVSCAALPGVADLASVSSVSSNAAVGAQQTTLTDAQTAVTAAQSALANAKAIASSSQK